MKKYNIIILPIFLLLDHLSFGQTVSLLPSGPVEIGKKKNIIISAIIDTVQETSQEIHGGFYFNNNLEKKSLRLKLKSKSSAFSDSTLYTTPKLELGLHTAFIRFSNTDTRALSIPTGLYAGNLSSPFELTPWEIQKSDYFSFVSGLIDRITKTEWLTLANALPQNFRALISLDFLSTAEIGGDNDKFILTAAKFRFSKPQVGVREEGLIKLICGTTDNIRLAARFNTSWQDEVLLTAEEYVKMRLALITKDFTIYLHKEDARKKMTVAILDVSDRYRRIIILIDN